MPLKTMSFHDGLAVTTYIPYFIGLKPESTSIGLIISLVDFGILSRGFTKK
jgi:hypothetical protein